MKKAWILLLALLLLLALVPLPAAAEDGSLVLSEDPAALSEAEAALLNAHAEDVLRTTGVMPCILYAANGLKDTLGAYTKEFFADRFAQEDAHVVLLGVSSENVYIGTKGVSLTDADLDTLLNLIEPGDGQIHAQLNRYLDVLLTLLFQRTEPAASGIESLPEKRLMPLLVDVDGLLPIEQYASLSAQLERISAEQRCDVAIVIPHSLDGKSATEFADDFYDHGGYGHGDIKDGILFLVCLEERDWATSTAGAAQDWFDDSVLYGIEDEVVPYLSSGDYFDAFRLFAEQCEEVLKTADRREVLYLSDLAGLLSNAQDARHALRLIESHSHVAGMDFVVLTTPLLIGQSPEEYLQAVYAGGDYRHGASDSKTALIVDWGAGRCYVLAVGYAGMYFSEQDIGRIETAVAEALSERRPFDAVETFVRQAFAVIEQYERDHGGPPALPKPPVAWLSLTRAFGSALVGLVIGLIVAFSLKGQLKSVRAQRSATDYIKRNSMRLIDQQDLFLYSNVTKTMRSTDSGGRSGGSSGGSHFSSSGVSHGGHSGKF